MVDVFQLYESQAKVGERYPLERGESRVGERGLAQVEVPGLEGGGGGGEVTAEGVDVKD